MVSSKLIYGACKRCSHAVLSGVTIIFWLTSISVSHVSWAAEKFPDRLWTDVNGKLVTRASLVTFDRDTVVLRQPSGQLITLPFVNLSTVDQDFLESQNAAKVCRTHCGENLEWVLRDGKKMKGQVIGYAPEQVVIQRRFGKVLVNDEPYGELPDDAQYVMRKFVEHTAKVPIPNRDALEKWTLGFRGAPRHLELEGVMLRAEVGDTFAVPFFLFPEGCQKFLKSGYDRWLTARANREKASQQELQTQRQAELLLRAKAADYLRNRNMAALLELSMVQSGIFDEWQVLLTPNPGTGGAPITVIVPARNSRVARLQAVSIYPNYTATIARVLNR